MKKFVIPIAAIVALTAMAIAASTIITPPTDAIKPILASEAETPLKSNGIEAEVKEDCCDKPSAAQIAEEKEDCTDCDKVAAKKDCDDCEESDSHVDTKVEASTL